MGPLGRVARHVREEPEEEVTTGAERPTTPRYAPAESHRAHRVHAAMAVTLAWLAIRIPNGIPSIVPSHVRVVSALCDPRLVR